MLALRQNPVRLLLILEDDTLDWSQEVETFYLLQLPAWSP